VSDPIHGSTDTKLAFAVEAKRQGADYFSSLMREKYFCVDQVVDHYSILSHANVNLVVHAMPFLSGYTGRSIDWPEEVFAALTAIEAVTAVKEDSKDVHLTRALIEKYGDEFDVVVAGRKRFLVDALESAQHSYINGVSMLNPHIAHTFWSLLETSVSRALAYVEAVDDPFWEGPVAKFGWHRVNKAALEAHGLMSRRERRPMPELSISEMPEVEKAAQEILEAHSQWIEASDQIVSGNS